MINKDKNKVQIIARILGGVFVFILTFAFSTLTYASEITPENIVNAVNREREINGLSPVIVSPQLQSAARKKSIDMIVRDYFDHYAFGLTPWSFIQNEGYNYSIAGENLAMGFSTAEGVVSAWMNSPMHRANILNPEFQNIGVGVVMGSYTENGQTNPTTMTTEMFATPKSKVSQLIDRVIATLNKLF